MFFDRFKLRCFFFLCFLFVHYQLTASTQSNFFSTQTPCSSEELAQELNERTLDMCWNFGQDSHFRFISATDEIYFEIFLGTLPDFFSDFVAKVKAKFIEKEFLIFSYKIKGEGTEEKNIPQSYEKKEHPNEDSYIVAERRVIENENPKHLSLEELETIVKDTNVLFYTGAGISLASDVPAMNELNELLSLEEGEKFLFSLENAIENPKEFASKITFFHNTCLYSSPTKAHIALKELAFFKNIRIITENVDCLHESSGIYPYRINAIQLRNEIGYKSLAQFQYIVCIGLSHDDHGFLGWYKQHYPQGKIISVDLHKPTYLGNEDFLVAGDLQEIIPLLQNRITH